VWINVAVLLAGVLLTALITGLAASWVLKLPMLPGLLLGSIVGSTDPMAIFLTLSSESWGFPRICPWRTQKQHSPFMAKSPLACQSQLEQKPVH
jgi:hypothetical protein